VETPPLSAMLNVLQELNSTLDSASRTQREIFDVTGTAWSEDRLIKAVVGPRGQLIELEIDPRVYRKPNSKALAASIVGTVREAVDQAVAKTQEILDRNLPKELRTGRANGMDVGRLIRSHDADLKKTLEEDES
jgi:DNA-binding protein YbaB